MLRCDGVLAACGTREQPGAKGGEEPKGVRSQMGLRSQMVRDECGERWGVVGGSAAMVFSREKRVDRLSCS